MLKLPRGTCFFLSRDPADRGVTHHCGRGRRRAENLPVKDRGIGLGFEAWVSKKVRAPFEQEVRSYTYHPLTTEQCLACGCPPDRLGGGLQTIPFPVFTLKVDREGVVRHVCGCEVAWVKV